MPPFLYMVGVTLEQGGGHDDQGQDDQHDNDFRAVHEAVIEAQMRLILLVKSAGVHVPTLPSDVVNPAQVMT